MGDSIRYIRKEAYTIFYALNRILKKGIYQGKHRTHHYFEGWYFKIDNEKFSFALIPGVSMEGEDAGHAFVQLLIGTEQSEYFSYPLQEFHFDKDDFLVQIGPNSFSADHVVIALKNDYMDLKGELFFSERLPWSKHDGLFGAMGPFRLFPLMECNHDVLCLRCKVNGYVLYNKRLYRFESSSGYQEKDWGTSFPSAWIWTQCNDFGDEDLSLMLSVARIPFCGMNFRGFLCGLYYQGTYVHFTTYNGSHLHITQENNSVLLNFSHGETTLEIGIPSLYHGRSLPAPEKGMMSSNVVESIKETISLKLYQRKNNVRKLICERLGHHAGVEISKIHRLL